MQAIPNDALNTIVDPSRKRKVDPSDEVSVMTKKKKEELRILKKVQKEMHEMVVIKTANQKRFEDMAEASIESESASLFTPPQTKPVVMGYDNGRSVYTVGEFVEVACDASPWDEQGEWHRVYEHCFIISAILPRRWGLLWLVWRLTITWRMEALQ